MHHLTSCSMQEHEERCSLQSAFYRIYQLEHGPYNTHKEKRLSCSFCGKAFSCPKHVEINQRMHMGEKQFGWHLCQG
ncbi:unnamed protein product [Oncorhynchus mykiss]|uniref:C2H2-type domain-containing protein n=1 Tax=Oncorhynchus mykiss TaxID=8022 RepID=A0A060VS45_ONCMY|nr:unnamed protein product [Oncorhynchus mykiss]